MLSIAKEVKANSQATFSHRRATVGPPARIYIYRLSADTGCSVEDLPGAIADRDGDEWE